MRRVNAPVEVEVRCNEHGAPDQILIGRPRPSWRSIGAILETWTIDDLWWTEQPVQRRYFMVQLAGGATTTVLYDEREASWYVQR